MALKFVEKVIEAFSKLKGEIDEKRGELDFRHSLANYFLRDVLGWGRKKGEGHFEIREREDIRLFDDHNHCAAIIETKNPRIARLTDAHRSELKEHLDDYKGMAQYGVLTNGHELKLFEYTGEGELNELASIDIDAFAGKGAEALSKTERQKVHLLRRLRKDRFVEVSPEYFRKTAQTIKIEEPRNFDLFIEDLRGSLDELTRVIYERFFKFYWEAGPNHYGGKFLREEAFPRWKGASTGKEEELGEKFCKETAYVILNRILFTRILEDKEIVKRMISGEGIADLLKWGEGAYEMALKQAYKNVEKFYEHFYESSIFDWWRMYEDKLGMLTEDEKRIQKEIEDEFNTVVVRDILKRLNQFDFRKVSRDILGDVYQEYLPPAERKQLGEFYTPVEVVRYILDAVGYIPENRIEDKLLLDPACGSGTFLIEASKRLADRYAEKLRNPLLPDNAKIIIEGIVNNIHGLDINPFACHIAEMNLLFNIIDYLHAVHSRYRDYRLPRFNICCTDSLMPPEMETAPITEYITNGRIRSHMEEAKRAREIKKKQFDFVVGNPPYVRQESMQKEMKEFLRRAYPETFDGMADLYVYFYHRGVKWLKEGGRFGYISSNMFVRRDYGKKLRNYILSACNTQTFVDFGDSGVFREVSNYPCILILEKRTGKKLPAQMYYVEVSRTPKGMTNEDILQTVKKVVSKDEEIELEGFEICKVKHPTPGEIWTFAPIERGNVLSKIESQSTNLLREYRKGILKGEETGANTVFIVDPQTIQKYLLEEELLKFLVRGKDIRKWKLHWREEFLIFPYKCISGEDVIIPHSEMIKKYPHMWRYLNTEENMRALRSRRRPIKQEFYELRTLVKSQWFDNPKIMTPDISNTNNFTYDESKYYIPTSAYVIVLKNGMDNKFYYLYFLGLLNSKTLEFYFKHRSPFVGGKYFRYDEPHLDQLPIKLPQTDAEKKISVKIEAHVDQLLQFNKQLDKLEEKIEKFPEPYFGNQKPKKLAAISDECKISKETLLVKSLAIESMKSKSGEKSYKLELTKGDYIIFSSREMAEYVLEWLKKKKRVRRSELLELKVPEDAAKVMNDFSSDKKRIDEIGKEVEKLEEETDKLVYELYGLDVKDREVIEEFLKKF